MNVQSPLTGAAPLAPHQRVIVADTRPVPHRAPEWPRLSRHEVRQIVLDVLG
jgi:hypothetical protein